MALWLGVFLARSAGSVGGVLYALSRRKTGTRLDAERLQRARAEAASIKRDAATAATRATRDAETVEREQGLVRCDDQQSLLVIKQSPRDRGDNSVQLRYAELVEIDAHAARSDQASAVSAMN